MLYCVKVCTCFLMMCQPCIQWLVVLPNYMKSCCFETESRALEKYNIQTDTIGNNYVWIPKQRKVHVFFIIECKIQKYYINYQMHTYYISMNCISLLEEPCSLM
jgi:hypothetical protein